MNDEASAGLQAPPSEAQLQLMLERIGSGSAQRELDEQRPFDAVEEIRKARFGALRIPLADGGGGRSLRELFDLLMLLAQADPNVAQILRQHFCFIERQIQSRHRESRERWLHEAAKGLIFGGASGEPSSRPTGRDIPETTLSPGGDGYVLRGAKNYTTGCLFADWITVLASTPEGEFATAVVPVDREGVLIEDDWEAVGQRLTASGTTHFRDVVVHADEVLPSGATEPVPGKPERASYFSTYLQLHLTATIAGILRRVVVDAVAVVRTRSRTYAHASADSPAEDPLLLSVIGEIASSSFAAASLVRAVAESLDAAAAAEAIGTADPQLYREAALLAAEAKVVVDELALRSATRLFDVGGGSATSRSLNLDRHWRNIRTLASHNPALYKARAIGALLVNDAELPAAFF